MKKFTYQQKRWVMATALLAVLAVNVSFNPHKEVGSANFASRATEDDEAVVEEEVEVPVFEGSYIKTKVRTRHGMMSVRYLNNGENGVLAVVPKLNTQGQFCPTCGYRTISLTSIENIEDVGGLNDALASIVDKSKIKRTKDEEEDLSEEEDNKELASVEEPETPKKKTALEKIKISCERRSREDVLPCIKEEFINVLTSRHKAKKIGSSEAQRFYKEEIEDRLLRQIINAKAVSSVNYVTFKEKVNESAKIISDLIAAMPEKYESVRDSLVDAEQTILSFKARQYKENQVRTLTTKDWTSFPRFMEQTRILEDELTYMHDTLGLRTEDALNLAVKKGILLPDVYDQYKEEVEKSNAAVLNYIAGRGPLLNGVTISPVVDLSDRIRASGRIQGSLGTSSINSAISSRASSSLTSTQTGLVPVTVYATPDGRIVIPENTDNGRLIIPENTGISFGEVTPITPRALQTRTQIRGDYRRK